MVGHRPLEPRILVRVQAPQQINKNMNIIVSHPYVILAIVIWSLFWKGYALWKSARNNQLRWFLAILIFNTAGVLPIIYLKFFQKSPKKPEEEKIS